MSPLRAWGRRDTTDGKRRGAPRVLDSGSPDMHAALVPPGTLHHRVTAALANWRLDDAEELLAGVDGDPTPYAAPEPDAEGAGDGDPRRALGRAWADTLRAELLVRRLRKAGFTLLGEPVDETAPALDLHAGVAGLIDGAAGAEDPRS